MTINPSDLYRPLDRASEILDQITDSMDREVLFGDPEFRAQVAAWLRELECARDATEEARVVIDDAIAEAEAAADPRDQESARGGNRSRKRRP